jgi:hypothetical protein
MRVGVALALKRPKLWLEKGQHLQRLAMSQHGQARGTGDMRHLETDGRLYARRASALKARSVIVP